MAWNKLRGKNSFNDGWLNQSDWSWLEKVNCDKTKGRCVLCQCNFDVSNMGVSSIKSHAKGKKHIERVKDVNSNNKLHNLSVASAPVCAESDSKTNVNLLQNERDSNIVTIVGNTSCSGSSLKEYVIKQDMVTCSEIIWALNMIFTHSSARSASDSSNLFPTLFPDSEIAKQFKMHKDKLGYVITYGLGQFFQNSLSSTIKDCAFFAVSFDESLNKVSQKGQMDIVIRFWNDGEVKTRYLTSCFLGHATSHDILMNFICALKEQGLDLKKMLQVSMDGPNVNLKFLKDLKSFLLEDSPDDPELLEFGTCSLHVVHGAYKTAHDKCGWEIHTFLRSLYYLFKDFPTRRADFEHITESSLFPLKFCSIRWIENSKVIQRALAILPKLKKYIKEVEQNPPKSKNFLKLKCLMKDPLLEARLGFMLSIALELEPFLTSYQSNQPLLPFLYTDLIQLLEYLMNRIVRKDILAAATSGMKLMAIDLSKASNLKPCKTVDIGFTAYNALKGKSEIQVLEFKGDCQKFMLALCLTFMKKCPLAYKLVRGASCLSPIVMINSTLRVQRLTTALEVLIEKKQISCIDADSVKKDYLDIVSKNYIQEKLKKFCRNDQRLDHFLTDILEKEKSSKALTDFIQKILVLYHSNAAVERSFSINKQCLVENLLENSLVAQRSTYEAVSSSGGVQNIDISKQMIHAFRNASAKRTEALRMKRKAVDEKAYKKITAAKEIKTLELKRNHILQQAKEEAGAIENEVKKLKRIV